MRNYYNLFEHHPDLEMENRPRPGDWAFYGRYHVALVVSVVDDGGFEVIEADNFRFRVVRRDDEYMDRVWGQPSFFGRIMYIESSEKGTGAAPED